MRSKILNTNAKLLVVERKEGGGGENAANNCARKYYEGSPSIFSRTQQNTNSPPTQFTFDIFMNTKITPKPGIPVGFEPVEVLLGCTTIARMSRRRGWFIGTATTIERARLLAWHTRYNFVVAIRPLRTRRHALCRIFEFLCLTPLFRKGGGAHFHTHVGGWVESARCDRDSNLV